MLLGFHFLVLTKTSFLLYIYNCEFLVSFFNSTSSKKILTGEKLTDHVLVVGACYRNLLLALMFIILELESLLFSAMSANISS